MKHVQTNKRIHFGDRAPSQPGFSLVELIVTMTAGAIVFGLSISAVERTMKLSKDASARAEHQLTVARLGRQLRSDVHAANGFHSITENSTIRLEMVSDQSPTVTYKITGSTVTRESTQKGSTIVSRETFRLADTCRVRMDVNPAEASRLDMAFVRLTPEGEMLEGHIVARPARLFPLQTLKKGQ